MHPGAVPAGWSVARLPLGSATMAYPPTWRRIASDPGTVSAAQVDADGLIVGYLDATPHQAGESLANWATFRPSRRAYMPRSRSAKAPRPGWPTIRHS